MGLSSINTNPPSPIRLLNADLAWAIPSIIIYANTKPFLKETQDMPARSNEPKDGIAQTRNTEEPYANPAGPSGLRTLEL